MQQANFISYSRALPPSEVFARLQHPLLERFPLHHLWVFTHSISLSRLLLLSSTDNLFFKRFYIFPHHYIINISSFYIFFLDHSLLQHYLAVRHRYYRFIPLTSHGGFYHFSYHISQLAPSCVTKLGGGFCAGLSILA